ncbi:MAG: tRNA glutamyl-Q(34) synthetase GluQRS [Alphaproteobacteria bacterium]
MRMGCIGLAAQHRLEATEKATEGEQVLPALRFAPSPNGPLHLGHALSAIEYARLAKLLHGRFLVRIEDVDQTRCRPEFEASIYDDLAMLGLAWEQPVRRQSEHLSDYAAALDRLTAMGLIYPSFESRGELKALASAHEAATGTPAPRDPDGALIYRRTSGRMSPDKEAARMASGAPFALRLDMASALKTVTNPLTWTEVDDHGEPVRTVDADPAAWGDVILARKEVPTSYHLSVVVDDAIQGISNVVRGEDLFAATAVHRLLQQLLGLPEPLYRHHRLVLGIDGRKLSKSEGATGLGALRAAGLSPADVRRQIGIADSETS